MREECISIKAFESKSNLGECYYWDEMSAATISGYDYINVETYGIETLADSVEKSGPHAISLYANEAFKR